VWSLGPRSGTRLSRPDARPNVL